MKFIIEVNLSDDTDPSDLLDRVIEEFEDEDASVQMVLESSDTERVKINAEALVTDDNVDSMIETAGYGGIAYWATSPTSADWEEAERRGAEFCFREQDAHDGGSGVHFLTREQVRQAFAKIASFDQKYVGDMIHGYFINSVRNGDSADGIETGDIDADAADVLVQVACFDKVVYG